jgi:predicted HTH domain antitoxin
MIDLAQVLWASLRRSLPNVTMPRADTFNGLKAVFKRTALRPPELGQLTIARTESHYTNAMRITLDIPDQFADLVLPNDRDRSRQALEDIAVEAYRTHRITEHELGTLLGLDRYELDGFLKKREVWLEYTIEDFQREGEITKNLREKEEANRRAYTPE